MSHYNGMPANFVVSPSALAEIEHIRQLYLAHWPSDPPAIPWVGWGTTTMNSGVTSDGVVVGFYRRSESQAVEHGVETVSGLALLFFITAENYGRFAGKILDHRPDRSFFLRD